MRRGLNDLRRRLDERLRQRRVHSTLQIVRMRACRQRRREFIQQVTGCSQITSVEAFRELSVDRGQNVARFRNEPLARFELG